MGVFFGIRPRKDGKYNTPRLCTICTFIMGQQLWWWKIWQKDINRPISPTNIQRPIFPWLSLKAQSKLYLSTLQGIPSFCNTGSLLLLFLGFCVPPSYHWPTWKICLFFLIPFCPSISVPPSFLRPTFLFKFLPPTYIPPSLLPNCVPSFYLRPYFLNPAHPYVPTNLPPTGDLCFELKLFSEMKSPLGDLKSRTRYNRYWPERDFWLGNSCMRRSNVMCNVILSYERERRCRGSRVELK